MADAVTWTPPVAKESALPAVSLVAVAVLLQAGISNSEKCSALVSSVLQGPITPTTSLPHEAILTSDAFGLCFLLLRLRGPLEAGQETVTIDDLLDTMYIDGLPLSQHLDFLQQRRADMDERKLRAKLIGPFLRLLLITTVEGLGNSIGGISFRSYDGEVNLLSFQYTLQTVSPSMPPADVLAFAADLLLGSQPDAKSRFVSFSFDGAAINSSIDKVPILMVSPFVITILIIGAITIIVVSDSPITIVLISIIVIVIVGRPYFRSSVPHGLVSLCRRRENARVC